MKTSSLILLPILASASLNAADVVTYTNKLIQVQLPGSSSDDYYELTNLASSGAEDSPLNINPNGARFELWTIKDTPYTEYLLDSRYVGSYVPLAQVAINSEDPHGKDLESTSAIPVTLPAMIRRTRADRPFTAYITVSGLLSGASDPEASKKVNLQRHVQSYGAGGTGEGLNRTQATLLTQSEIAANGTQTLVYALNSVPGTNRAKVRGEETFSVWSLLDNRTNGTATYTIQPNKLASQFIQIWPVADSTISGITQDQLIRFAMPTLTITVNDIYPGGRIYAQAYKGNQSLGTVGTLIPGSNRHNTSDYPGNETLSITSYDAVFPDDGRWTIEVLTETPFGVDRLAYLSFTVDRTLELNSNLSTIR